MEETDKRTEFFDDGAVSEAFIDSHNEPKKWFRGVNRGVVGRRRGKGGEAVAAKWRASTVRMPEFPSIKQPDD